jgi:hypothetical protein
MVKPVTETAIPVPTLTLAKVATGEPPSVTESLSARPETAGVPVNEALLVPSYGLLLAVMPVMVSALLVMLADRPATTP